MADVEFEVELTQSAFYTPEREGHPYKSTQVFDTFDAAAGMAIARAASSGEEVYINVLVYSEAGAKAIQGDSGVETYREDPEASVFERIVIRADSQGRIA